MIQELSREALVAHIDQFYFVQIILVILCGGIVGFERQNRDKPLGMRTSILIALGTMVFIKSGLMILDDYSGPGGDPSRVLGQVVTGIGFLGAGSIMTRDGSIHGLTTAATIWVQAAIGALIAIGLLVDAVIFTIVTLLILYGISHIERRFQNLFRRRRRHRKVEPEEK